MGTLESAMECTLTPLSVLELPTLYPLSLELPTLYPLSMLESTLLLSVVWVFPLSTPTCTPTCTSTCTPVSTMCTVSVRLRLNLRPTITSTPTSTLTPHTLESAMLYPLSMLESTTTTTPCTESTMVRYFRS